jgi:cell division inhibitor SepF
MGIPTEFVLLQPRSFAEIPQAVQALRQCKSIVLNLCFLDPDQAQRCADYVAGGTFAIDGYQQRLDETIFLFTPSFVQINHQSPSHLLPDEYVQPPDQPLEKGSVRSSESYQSLRSPTVSLDTYEPLPLAD